MAFRLGRKKWLVLAIVVAVAAVAAKVATLVRFGPPVTISKETTFITEPLRPDGFPDYVGALNQHFSEGVTPENNSSVLFWKAVGPKMIDKKFRKKFFRMLGIPPLPEKGDYFVASDEHQNAKIARKTGREQPLVTTSEENRQLWEQQKQLELARKRPWSKEEYPEWAEWIAVNEKPLALLVEATKRPRRYDPMIGEKVICILLWGPQRSRDVARALVARAMLRIHEGKVEEAWRDLLACHRLARLIGQGPTFVEASVAAAIDGMACNGDQALLEHGKLTSVQIATMREDFSKLPPMPVMADKMDEAERIMFLDCVVTMAREGLGLLTEFSGVGGGGKSKNPIESLAKSIGIAAVDWDFILRMGNSWCDRIVAGMRKPTRAERKATGSAIEDDLKKLTASAKDLKSLAWSMLGGPRKAISERIGQSLVTLLLPAYSAASEAECRATMRIELNDLAFALAAYRAEHGAYPAKLDELVPKYVKTMPKDIFNDDLDLHYTRQGDGYLLYSVGSNGTDDGGKGDNDRKEGEDWDDLVVRIPSKPEG